MMSDATNKEDNQELVKHRFAWLDIFKAVAVLWIFTNHFSEQIFGYPYIANPTPDWPPLSERIAQLAPLQGYGIEGVLLNILRYVGWFGDQGVQIFIIISGFGLTWGFLNRIGQNPLKLWSFYIKRSERVYPLWWGAHLLFLAVWLVTGLGLSAFDPKTYLSAFGIRFTSELFYYFSPAWWYIGLLVQLYLIFPFLWAGLRRLGPVWLLVIACLVCFPARAYGLLNFTTYMDPWQRGSIFITRLPEFVLGISLAYWFYKDRNRIDHILKSIPMIMIGICTYAVGMVLSLFLLGMAFAPFLLGVGLFILFYNLLSRIPLGGKVGAWIGRHSYSLYLIHHPIILFVVPLGIMGLLKMGVNALLAAAFTLVIAVSLEWGVSWIQRWIAHHRQWKDRIKVALAMLSVGAVILVGLVAGELFVRAYAPQEVLGWGERPSLEPDDVFGWKLIPSKETRLRWEGYDYIVNANSLGFPGPEYSIETKPDILRILVVGDAFSSAEGVDTDQSWPRLLEKELSNRLGWDVQVLNFAVTGFGPNQYEAIIEKFAPSYQPDMILVQMFVNDYQDVLWSNSDFQTSIGFSQPDSQGIASILRLVHLRRMIQLRVIEPLKEFIRDKPREHGYFLGNYRFLEIGDNGLVEEGKEEVLKRLERMKSIADKIGSGLMVLMVPAPVQVCEPNQLTYNPRNVDLSDASQYNLDLPQNEMAEITNSLETPMIDLRSVLKAAQPECLYRSDNMHWTKQGHINVAIEIANWLAKSEILSTNR